MSIITKGLGSSLLITQGYGQRTSAVIFIDPYCKSISPYSPDENVFMPFTRIGTCLSEIAAKYDTILLWPLQLKTT